MKIDSIVIRNFGPHNNTEISFDDPVTAICGHNGVGKTFLLESIPATLFGYWPSRGALYEGISQGFTGDCYLQVAFTFNGNKYVAERKIRKTAKTCTQEAILSCNGIAITSTKVTDFEEAIKVLLGDDKIFFASAFSAQNQYGDLVECGAVDRKKILGELLDLSRFTEKSQHYTDQYNLLKSKLDNFEQRKQDLEESIVPINSVMIPEFEQTLAQLNSQKLKIQDEQGEIVKEIAIIETEYQSFLKEKDRYVLLSDTIKQKERERDLLADMVNNIEQIKASIETCKQIQKTRCEFIEINEKRAKINQDALETRAYNQSLINQHKSALAEIQQHNYAIQLKEKEVLSQINQLEKDKEYARQTHKRNIDSLKSRSEILSSGDFGSEACNTCRFTSDARKANQELSELKPEPDTSEIESSIEKLLQNIQLLKHEIKGQPLYPELKKEEVILELNPLPEDQTFLLAKRQEQLKAAESVGEDRKKLTDEINNLFDEIEKIDINKEAMLAKSGAELSNKRKSIEILLKENDSNIIQIIQSIEQERSKVEHNDNLQKKIKSLEADNQEDINLAKVFKYLSQAFGRSGIQALLIDSAIPKLQAVSNQLLSVAEENKMSLSFSTIKENKSGTSRESLEIIATDGRGSRDISTYSGGEQKLLRSILRLTLAIFQSQTSSKKLMTLFMDELFDSLDPDNAEKLLKVLMSIPEYFERVIFISHTEELLADFDNKIFLEQQNGKTICRRKQ